MPDESIDLECTRVPVVYVVPDRVPPANCHSQQCPEGKHRDHTYSQVKQRMRSMPEPSLASHHPGAGSLREVVRCCIYLPWRSRCATTFGIFSLCALPLMYFFCVVRLFWAQPRGT